MLTLGVKLSPRISDCKIFSTNPPLNFPEEGKRFLAVTSFEETNSISNPTEENKRFSTSTPGCFRIELRYSETTDILDTKHTPAKTMGYAIKGIYEISDRSMMLKSLLPNEVKMNITVDDIRLRSNLTTNKTVQFTEQFFFYTVLGFTQSHSVPLGEPPKRFIHLIARTYKSENPYNNIGTLMKFIKNVVARIDLLLMVLGNLFFSVLH